MMVRLFIMWVCAVWMAIAAHETVLGQPQTAYQRGLELVYSGQLEQALDTWEAYYEENERVDSRVGFEYIGIVTGRGITGRYTQATDMYYQALLKAEGVASQIALRQEIERLRPIVGQGVYRQWITMLEEEHTGLPIDLYGYWVQLDPTPASTQNERLIEHWIRIAEAQQRFTRNASTIYGADERALVYVRYGEPDRVRNGILTLQDLNVKPWLERQVLTQLDPDLETQRPLESSEARQIRLLENAIYEFHRYPEYEIWFYDRLSDAGEASVPFFFGTNIQNEQFEMLAGIDSFIPERAFQRNAFRDVSPDHDPASFTREGLTPALMLQMLYYEQLSRIDPFFDTRLNALKDAVIEQDMNVLRGFDRVFKEENQSLVQHKKLDIPQEQSTYRAQVPQIPVSVHHYRFLDEENRPQLVTIVESEPQESFLIDFNRNRPDGVTIRDLEVTEDITNELSDYSFLHRLVTLSTDWQTLDRVEDRPPLRLRRSVRESRASLELVTDHTGRLYQAVSAILLNENPRTGPAYQTPYPPAMRGLGSRVVRQPEPLRADTDSLQMADLVLGYQMLDEPVGFFPFIVANDQAVPWLETLVLRFEVYNLEMQDNGFSQFELTYRILPIEEDGRVITDQAEFVLTLNFTSEFPRLDENLEIETADLQPGLYELRMVVTDVNSRQEVRRTIRFEVVE
ncbi:MAG: GWxTD domain-containing protein [Balneolaceae bacterium]